MPRLRSRFGFAFRRPPGGSVYPEPWENGCACQGADAGEREVGKGRPSQQAWRPAPQGSAGRQECLPHETRARAVGLTAIGARSWLALQGADEGGDFGDGGFVGHEYAVREPESIPDASFSNGTGFDAAAAALVERVPVEGMGIEGRARHAVGGESLVELIAGAAEALGVDAAEQ